MCRRHLGNKGGRYHGRETNAYATNDPCHHEIGRRGSCCAKNCGNNEQPGRSRKYFFSSKLIGQPTCHCSPGNTSEQCGTHDPSFHSCTEMKLGSQKINAT